MLNLKNALKDYFSTDPQDALHMPADSPAQPSEDEDAAISQPKHPCLDSHCEDQDATDIAPPAFTVQWEWVSVYFDYQFYVGGYRCALPFRSYCSVTGTNEKSQRLLQILQN